MIYTDKSLYAIMNEKYQNQYRIPSARLQTWNYGWEGKYFITICTKDKLHYFGKILNGKMILSNIGVIANLMWCEIRNHQKNVELGEFVVMPNHAHGILILNNINPLPVVQTGHALFVAPGQQRFLNQGKNTISSIIGSYKSAVTKHCNQLGLTLDGRPAFTTTSFVMKRLFKIFQTTLLTIP